MRLSEAKLTLAREVCTPRQLEVVELRQEGAGWKIAALVLGLSRSTVREHWEAALNRIETAERRAA